MSNTIKVRKGQTWKCGKWGVLEIVSVGPKTVSHPRILLKLIEKGENTVTYKYGERISLLRSDFDFGEYTRIS